MQRGTVLNNIDQPTLFTLQINHLTYPQFYSIAFKLLNKLNETGL